MQPSTGAWAEVVPFGLDERELGADSRWDLSLARSDGGSGVITGDERTFDGDGVGDGVGDDGAVAVVGQRERQLRGCRLPKRS